MEEQRKLIDDYIGTEPYLEEERKILLKLKKNSKFIITTQESLDKQRQKASDKNEIETRISELEKHTENDVFKEHDKWEKEKRLFETSAQREEELNRLAVNFIYEIDSLPKISDETPNASDIERYYQVYTTLKSTLREKEGKLHSSILESITKLKKIRGNWKKKYDKEDEALAEKLKELGVSERAVIFKELQDRKTALKIITEEVIPKIKELNKKLNECTEERKKLLEELYQARKNLTEKRLELVKHFNDELQDTVRISIEVESEPSLFIEKLKEMYDGSGIKNRENIWTTLIDQKLTPIKLADLILLKDITTLESFGISSDAFSKLIQHPSLKQIHELQTIKMEDIPNISLKKEGEYDFTPLRELSFGEKCSAILSIVMLNKKTPLIIDQPEDELDHAFITENVVTTIRKIKNNRQLLISTHNPNIPVLGDAELVIKVKKVPRTKRCIIERARGLEDNEILNHLKILEGGAEALQKRSQKYGLKFWN